MFVSWLILQRLEDIKRDQDRLWAEFDGLRRQVQQEIASVRQEIGQLRQEVDQKFTRLTGCRISQDTSIRSGGAPGSWLAATSEESMDPHLRLWEEPPANDRTKDCHQAGDEPRLVDISRA